MELDPHVEETHAEEFHIPFTLTALGYIPKPLNASQSDKPPSHPPWDISHLSYRNYTVKEAPLLPSSTSTEQEYDLPLIPETRIDEITADILPKSNDMKSTYPWETLHDLLNTKYQQGDIPYMDFMEWSTIHGVSRGEYRIEDMHPGVEEELAKCFFLNEVLAWVVAVDYRWGFEGADDFIRGLGEKKLPLMIARVNMAFVVEVDV